MVSRSMNVHAEYLPIYITAWKSPFNATVKRYNIHKNLTFIWIYAQLIRYYIASLIWIYDKFTFSQNARIFKKFNVSKFQIQLWFYWIYYSLKLY